MDQIQFKTLHEFLKFNHENVQNFTRSEMQLQLQILMQMLNEKQMQTEAKNDSFFKRWNQIKLPINLITIDFISQLSIIYTILNENLKEDILLDFIWPLILQDFEETQVVIEYFNTLKTIYSQKYRELFKSFGMLEIVKFMLKTTEIDQMICCEQHNNKEQPLQIVNLQIQTKIDQFSLFINDILHQMVKDLLQSQGNNMKDLEQQFCKSIHQILSYCTTDHNSCQVEKLMIILLNQLSQIQGDLIQKIFQNFESLGFLVLLYNSTTILKLQIYSIKLFQVITSQNHLVLQQLILSIIPSSRHNSLAQNLHTEPLIYALLEWLLNIPISTKIYEYQMFDEKLTFQNHNIMELVLTYLYLSPILMQQQLITTLYTLIRKNKENQLFMLSNKHFLSTFPKYLMGLQDQILIYVDDDRNSLCKSIYDTSLKLISIVFMNQIQNGKIDMLYQWLKLAEIENMKLKNVDVYRDNRTPNYLIRQLITYVFNMILKSSIKDIEELENDQLWKGFQLIMVSFLGIISKDVIQNDCRISKIASKKAKLNLSFYLIIQLQDNQQWIDYQFCYKIVQIVNLLYKQTISMNLDITKPSVNFKTQEYSIWLNKLFEKILNHQKDNIFLMRVIQTLICYYSQYIVAQNLGQQQLEEIQQLLKAYRYLMQSLICGSQQLKNKKQIPIDLEKQVSLSHYFYMESQMKLLNQIKQRSQKDHHSSHDSFFNLYALQELIAYIQQQLQEYYISLLKLCQIYWKRQQNFIWNFCYELIRMKKQDGEILESYLQTLINHPDIINEIVVSDEMIIYYHDCPNLMNLKQKSQLRLNELIRWVNLLIQKEEHQQIVFYQEQYKRQSQILLKDVTKTLDKYNLIQLQNYEIFEQEKLKFDQSKTL